MGEPLVRLCSRANSLAAASIWRRLLMQALAALLERNLTKSGMVMRKKIPDHRQILRPKRILPSRVMGRFRQTIRNAPVPASQTAEITNASPCEKSIAAMKPKRDAHSKQRVPAKILIAFIYGSTPAVGIGRAVTPHSVQQFQFQFKIINAIGADLRFDGGVKPNAIRINDHGPRFPACHGRWFGGLMGSQSQYGADL